LAHHLLAVDDSKTMRTILEMTFAGEDVSATVVGSAEEALASLASGPQIALIDAALNGTDGYSLCEQIKAQAPGIGVILLSSKHGGFDAARAANAGADDHIDKPFDTQVLIEKVAALASRGGAVRPNVSETSPAPASSPRATPPPKPPAAGDITDDSMPTVPPPGSASVGAVAPSAAPVASAAASATSNGSQLAGKLGDLGLSQEQIKAVLTLSREVVEQVVWEVVPDLAESIIREEIRRLTSE